MRHVFISGLALLAALALAACAGTPVGTTTEPTAQAAVAATTLGALTISDPWVRPVGAEAPPATEMSHSTDAPMASSTAAPMGDSMAMSAASVTGGYMTIANSGAEADALVAVAAPADLVETVELHTMIEEGGVMKMRPVEQIEVPAGGEVALKPGSYHIMFIGVKRELKPGDLIRLSLTFAQAGTVELDAAVRPATPMP